jgi:leader peptidase (prepilin peptidase)/N-methyltransferase
MTALVAAISGIYGLVIGSFLNVVIWRVPRKESLVKPASHCPGCDTKIANRDNVPVVSWLLLRGRCRNCGTAISVRYPFIELFTAVLFAAVGARFAHSWALPAYLVLTAALVALSAIDLEHYILPNRILYPTDGAAIVLLGVASAATHDWGRSDAP